MDQHRLLTFAKEVAHYCFRVLWKRVLWSAVKSFAESCVIVALLFYIGASFTRRPENPNPHFLNAAEYKAAFFEIFNHFENEVHAGGCGR
jgi:hypothetical protein